MLYLFNFCNFQYSHFNRKPKGLMYLKNFLYFFIFKWWLATSNMYSFSYMLLPMYLFYLCFTSIICCSFMNLLNSLLLKFLYIFVSFSLQQVISLAASVSILNVVVLACVCTPPFFFPLTPYSNTVSSNVDSWKYFKEVFPSFLFKWKHFY